jgi:hypothetical protein
MAIRRTCFRRFWTLLEAKLTDSRATSGSSISILDAGCGPGTWLRRLVTRAHVLEADQSSLACNFYEIFISDVVEQPRIYMRHSRYSKKLRAF